LIFSTYWRYANNNNNYYYYLRNGQSCGLQIWPLNSQCPSEQNRIQNCGEKGVWAYPGTVQNYLNTYTIISGTGKATDFKFGPYIHSVHPNKSPLKRLEKK